MSSISISADMSRDSARDILHELANAQTARSLRFEDPVEPVSPLAYARLMQLIVSWGLQQQQTELHLEGVRSNEEWGVLLRKSDHLLVACLLSTVIVDSAKSDITDFMFGECIRVCERRNVLTYEDVERPHRSSIVLPEFIPNLSHSPDLHTHSADGWRIQEDARSLYHDIWLPRAKAAALREPNDGVGEERGEDDNGAWISRRKWPRGYPKPVPNGEFRPLAARAFPGTGDLKSSINRARLIRPVSDDIGEVLFELVQNTQWHAINHPGGTTGRNLRLLSFSRVKVSEALVDSLDVADAAMARYLRRLLANGSSHGDAEVSIATILDSGSGLARSAARRQGRQDDVNEDTEVAFLKQALEKTINVSPRSMGDYGLPRVQWLLTELRGFMSIRSGGLQLRRDFVEKPFAGGLQNLSPGKLSESERFIDWVPSVEEGIGHGPCVGTCVTFILPFGVGLGGDEN